MRVTLGKATGPLNWLVFSLFVLFPLSPADRALGEDRPPCIIDDAPAQIDNQDVLHWKQTTQNLFKARAYVSGVVSRSFGQRNGHAHFEIKIGPRSDDTLEVVYNLSFGSIPAIQKGMQVEACGDYITSNEDTDQYPASPSGAIIHWVHRNPDSGGHESGFIVLDDKVYGYDLSADGVHGSARPGKRHPSQELLAEESP